MKFQRLGLLLSLLLLASCSYNTPEKAVFVSGTEGYECFRIPAIVQTVNGRLLAFAEGRRDGCSDTGQIDLVMKSSEDDGLTWSPIKVIRNREGFTSGNPAPIVDTTTGKIYLLLTQNLGEDAEHEIIDEVSTDTRRIFVMSSMDNGDTWTEANEITQDVKLANWTWYATGPGSGIQIQSGEFAGRMMLGCDHIEAGTKKYFSHVIYSDDGISWNLGGSTPQHQVNECEVAELSSGELMLNMRNYDTSVRVRRSSRSKDGGDTWSDLEVEHELIEPICQASFHRHSYEVDGNIAHLFSNPASDSSRTHMTLRMSLDDAATWEGKFLMHEGPSAYSDLVSIDETTIGLLYEGGINSPYEEIRFVSIKIGELMGN